MRLRQKILNIQNAKAFHSVKPGSPIVNSEGEVIEWAYEKAISLNNYVSYL